MKEKNKHILIEGISNLPQYQPKSSLWDVIEMELTIDVNEKSLKRSVATLPLYDPPKIVWENLDKELGKFKDPNAKVFKLNFRKWGSVAAIFALVSVGLWTFFNVNNNQEIVEIAYSEESSDASFLEINWEEDEDAFEMVAAYCKTDHVVCKLPEFKILTEELDELNAARVELKEAMEHYGNDPDLIAQLTSIEHERTDVLKQIIKRI